MPRLATERFNSLVMKTAQICQDKILEEKQGATNLLNCQTTVRSIQKVFSEKVFESKPYRERVALARPCRDRRQG